MSWFQVIPLLAAPKQRWIKAIYPEAWLMRLTQFAQHPDLLIPEIIKKGNIWLNLEGSQNFKNLYYICGYCPCVKNTLDFNPYLINSLERGLFKERCDVGYFLHSRIEKFVSIWPGLKAFIFLCKETTRQNFHNF